MTWFLDYKLHGRLSSFFWCMSSMQNLLIHYIYVSVSWSLSSIQFWRLHLVLVGCCLFYDSGMRYQITVNYLFLYWWVLDIFVHASCHATSLQMHHIFYFKHCCLCCKLAMFLYQSYLLDSDCSTFWMFPNPHDCVSYGHLCRV